MSQNILITWHIPSYGIGYFKNVLAAFYTGKVLLNQRETVEGMSQVDLERGFLNSGSFFFDKVYYLYFSDETSIKLSYRTKSDYIDGRVTVELLKDDIIGPSKTLKIWMEVLKMNLLTIKEELSFVQMKYPEKYPSFLSQYWRNIHYYPIDQQIEWFEMYSNASKIYNEGRLEFINFTQIFGITDLRDEEKLTISFASFLSDIKKTHISSNFFLNSGLGTFEMQFAFRNVISDSRFNDLNISLFSFVDQKENTKINYRFRDLKYAFKNSYLNEKVTKTYDNVASSKDSNVFPVYPNKLALIKFEQIAFITKCDRDSSNNDRYLQTMDRNYFRIVKFRIEDLEKLLPQENFCRINKSTIISNYEGNIQGCSRNCDELWLNAPYIKNDGSFIATKKSEEEYNKMVNQPVTFTIGSQYKEKFKRWYINI